MASNLKIRAQSANCFSQEILHITNEEIGSGVEAGQYPKELVCF